MRILIVEDNPVFRGAMIKFLISSHPDWVIDTCELASEAIDMVKTHTDYSLALVDIGLPDMDGIALLRQVHTFLPDLPIVIITVLENETKLLNAIRAGARGYLLKSDSTHALLAGIHAAVNGQYLVSPKLSRVLFKLLGGPHTQSSTPEVQLSKRELDTLRLLAKGHSYAEVADVMQVTLSTVQTNVKSIYRKLDATSKTEAINKAQAADLL
jgi:two-component system, NarL family, nitrate/nitrite response regulator NarL